MRFAMLFLLAALLSLTSVAEAQRVSIVEQPDSARRFFCTYRTASGAAASDRDVAWTVRKPAVARVVAVPGTTRMRYVYVHALGIDSTAVVCSATVSGVTYRDSVALKGLQVTKLVAVHSDWPGVVAPPPPPPVTPPPPPPVTGTNEPAGMNVIVDYGCETRPLAAWQTTQPGYMSARTIFVTEAGNNLCRFANPAGADDYGSGSIVVSGDPARSEIYSRAVIRPAANFLAHPIATKFLYIFAGGGGLHAIPALGGSTMAEPIRFKMINSGGFASASLNPSGSTINWPINRDRNVDIVRGQWNTVEFHGKLNTPGAMDGIFRLWVNGRLVFELTDVRYRTNTSGWGEHDVIFYHGGMGFPIPTASHMDFDYFYVSGR